MSKRKYRKGSAGTPESDATKAGQKEMTNEEAFFADWGRGCGNCGAKPVVAASGLCGPCTFGEADTAGGNW